MSSTIFASEYDTGTRIVITDPMSFLPEFVGAVGYIVSVHDADCVLAKLEVPVLGYTMIHAGNDQFVVSPYQGEPLVAVNNHD